MRDIFEPKPLAPKAEKKVGEGKNEKEFNIEKGRLEENVAAMDAQLVKASPAEQKSFKKKLENFMTPERALKTILGMSLAALAVQDPMAQGALTSGEATTVLATITAYAMLYKEIDAAALNLFRRIKPKSE